MRQREIALVRARVQEPHSGASESLGHDLSPWNKEIGPAAILPWRPVAMEEEIGQDLSPQQMNKEIDEQGDRRGPVTMTNVKTEHRA